MVGILLLVISLVIVVVLAFRGIPMFFSAVIASAFCLITSQLFNGGGDFVTGLTSTYISGLANYVESYFWLFILGALFGKLYEVTGAATSIAEGIINKLGEKAIIPAVIIVGFLLTYGGVSVFVCFFAMYPLLVSMFKRADIPRYLLPAFYFAGAGTASGWVPGSPQAHNIIAADALGVGYNVAAVPGWIGGIIEMLLVAAWLYWCVAQAKKKGEHFVENEKDKEALAAKGDRKNPGFLLSLIPMIVLIILLNAAPFEAAVSLALGFFAALICFVQYLDWSNIWNILKDGLMGGVTTLFNTASIVGFGSVVQATPAFQTIIAALNSLPGSGLPTSLLATAIMAGICGSGTGGEGIAMPIINEYFVPNMTQSQILGLARMAPLASLTLDSLPHCGLVVSVIDYTGNKHYPSYLYMCVVNVIIPIIMVPVMLLLCTMFGFA